MCVCVCGCERERKKGTIDFAKCLSAPTKGFLLLGQSVRTRQSCLVSARRWSSKRTCLLASSLAQRSGKAKSLCFLARGPLMVEVVREGGKLLVEDKKKKKKKR